MTDVLLEGCSGTVSWNINTACNYRCSYCTQRTMEDRGRWSRDTPLFLEAFSRLPGPWEVKISGGEPFVHPTLLEIVAGLAQQRRTVSIVTNFSASQQRLEAFLEAAGQHLGVFSCSLHLEYADPEAFLAKACWLLEQGAPWGQRGDPTERSLNVTCVATRANLPLLPELERRFRQAGICFKVQPEKQDGQVIGYVPHEQEQLLSLGGHNLLGEVSFHFRGRPCWAGSRYFILDDRGVAYRCYPARRAKLEKLGNFLSPDFRLRPGPSPCQYDYCNCTVPIQRGMVL